MFILPQSDRPFAKGPRALFPKTKCAYGIHPSPIITQPEELITNYPPGVRGVGRLEAAVEGGLHRRRRPDLLWGYLLLRGYAHARREAEALQWQDELEVHERVRPFHGCTQDSCKRLAGGAEGRLRGVSSRRVQSVLVALKGKERNDFTTIRRRPKLGSVKSGPNAFGIRKRTSLEEGGDV
ncbi:hypothetical protein QR680_009690 [Steinernema hermaphroditum]|uniref:Uncharacterized protein n=1 Tax=Steinernema hermaphroditum TaxID=289476 RepID=A0AA39IMN6_9BILA|nr:hypothetical protein QR680_009690 [Steinernema hermaphroditum]